MKRFGPDLHRYALVDPVLRAMGWATDDPGQVRVEFPAGTAGGGKADYCLLDSDGKPRVLQPEGAVGGHRRGRVCFSAFEFRGERPVIGGDYRRP